MIEDALAVYITHFYFAMENMRSKMPLAVYVTHFYFAIFVAGPPCVLYIMHH